MHLDLFSVSPTIGCSNILFVVEHRSDLSSLAFVTASVSSVIVPSYLCSSGIWKSSSCRTHRCATTTAFALCLLQPFAPGELDAVQLWLFQRPRYPPDATWCFFYLRQHQLHNPLVVCCGLLRRRCPFSNRRSTRPSMVQASVKPLLPPPACLPSLNA